MKQGDTGLVQALRRIVGDLAALPVETSVAVAHIAAALQDVLQQHTEKACECKSRTQHCPGQRRAALFDRIAPQATAKKRGRDPRWQEQGVWQQRQGK